MIWGRGTVAHLGFESLEWELERKDIFFFFFFSLTYETQPYVRNIKCLFFFCLEIFFLVRKY